MHYVKMNQCKICNVFRLKLLFHKTYMCKDIPFSGSNLLQMNLKGPFNTYETDQSENKQPPRKLSLVSYNFKELSSTSNLNGVGSRCLPEPAST